MAISARSELVDRMRVIRDGESGWRTARLFAPLSDLAAALGLSQLDRYPESLERRRALGLSYLEALKRCAPWAIAGFPIEESMFFRLPLEVEGGTGRYQAAFLERGVRVSKGVDVLLHRSRGLPDAQFAQSARLFDRTLCLPIYPALSDEEFGRCVDAAAELLSDARS
jgi:UDP-4-amino-4-deoxy-L-arabinose-oxoglutarate aminotransferase